MYCPSCGTQNTDTNRFCIKCGTALPAQISGPPSSRPVTLAPQPTPRNPASSAATIGGLAGLGGGALAIIGWFMPWSAIQGINGLQVTLSAFTAGIAALGLTDGAFGYSSQVNNVGGLLGIIALVIAVAYGSIPVIGIACVRTGLKLVELRPGHPNAVKHEIGTLKSRSTTGFVLMLTLYLIPMVLSAVIISVLPFLLLAQQLFQSLGLGLGGGYFVAGSGFVLAFVGAIFARSQLVDTGYQLQNGRAISPFSSSPAPTVSVAPSAPSTPTPTLHDETPGEKQRGDPST
jgi:hypothetical protein